MPISKLPKAGSPEEQNIFERVKAGEANQVAQELGYQNRDALLSALRRRGVLISEHVEIPSIETEEKLTELEHQVLNMVQQKSCSVGEISRTVDRSRETIIKTLDDLREKSYEINLDEVSREVSIPQEPSKEFKPTEFKYFKKSYRIGLVSDPHFGSKYQQITLLHDAYAEFNRRQVDFVLNAGDLVDGKNLYRGQDQEVFLQGADAQTDYVIQNYPKLERNRKTYIIGGSHDRSFFRDRGHNVIRAICKERKDLVYKGFYKAEFTVKGLSIGLQHPGGGVAYALSYKPQKIIESMMGYIGSVPNAPKPILQLFGHWHVAVHIPSYMGVDVVSLPCFQSQTPYLEQLGKMPVVGYAIAEISLDKDNNLSRTNIEFFILNSRIIKNDFVGGE